MKPLGLLGAHTYCNLDAECQSQCCLDKRCAPVQNDCLALRRMEAFVAATYCSYNVDCPESQCCHHGECAASYDTCFQRYDLPLLWGGFAGFVLALIVLLFAYLLTPRKKVKVVVPPEEPYVDDGGPIYYEAEPEALPPPDPEPEPFKDDMAGPLYYEQATDLKPAEPMEETAPVQVIRDPPQPYQDDLNGPLYYESEEPKPAEDTSTNFIY